MRKIILSQPGCSKCKSLAANCPDAEVVELDQALLLSLARAVNITSLPIVVLTGDVEELSESLKKHDELSKDKAVCLGIGLRYEDALKEIAACQKVNSIGCGSQDNSFEVETARTALGLPLDIPEYDNPDYEERNK